MQTVIAIRIGMFNFHLLKSLYKLALGDDLFPSDFTSLDVIRHEVYLVIDMKDETHSGLYNKEEFDTAFATTEPVETNAFIEIQKK